MSSKHTVRFVIFILLATSLIAFQNCSFGTMAKFAESLQIRPEGGGDGYPGRPEKPDDPNECYPTCPDQPTEEDYISTGQCGLLSPAVVNRIRVKAGAYDKIRENCDNLATPIPIKSTDIKPTLWPIGLVSGNVIYDRQQSPQPLTLMYCESKSNSEGRAQVTTYFERSLDFYGQDTFSMSLVSGIPVNRAKFDGDASALQKADGSPGPSIPVGSLVYKNNIPPNQVGHFAIYYGSGGMTSAIVLNNSARGKLVFSGDVECWKQDAPLGF